MKSISLGDVSGFFTWKLDQKRGVAGRRLRGIKEASSLATYRKMFLRVYRKLVGADMDSEMARGTLNVGYIPSYSAEHTPEEKLIWLSVDSEVGSRISLEPYTEGETSHRCTRRT